MQAILHAKEAFSLAITLTFVLVSAQLLGHKFRIENDPSSFMEMYIFSNITSRMHCSSLCSLKYEFEVRVR